LERAKGIEPSSTAWEADALPLCYARTPRFYWGFGAKSRGTGACRYSEKLKKAKAKTVSSEGVRHEIHGMSFPRFDIRQLQMRTT
jgi:hypothetical protein